jgi:hypothetical protein
MSSNTKFYGNIAVSEYKGIGVSYTFKNTNASNVEAPTAINIQVKDKKGKIASWGANNDYPQKILKAIKASGSGSSALRFLRKAHYGTGLILMNNAPDDNGKKSPKLINILDYPEINKFFKTSQLPRFFKEIIADMEWFSISFPEYILSNNFKTINRVKRHQTAWCRFEIMNPENGLVENIYISEKFGKESVAEDSPYVSKVPLIDSYWSPDEVREYCKANKIYKFVRPVFYPLIDEAYYPQAEWHSVVNNGWLDVANSIPEYKKNIFLNQVSIKYLIEVDERYFENIYSTDWKDYTVEERKKIREDLIDGINESLVGNTNAAKSIQSMMFMDDKNAQVSALKITSVDDKLKDGIYLPEAEAANSEILFAIGVDPSLIGAGIPGGKLGAGSGSDKNAAFNILQSLKKTDRESTLEIFDFIAGYNAWDETITANFENTVLTTLDKNPTGTQTATI